MTTKKRIQSIDDIARLAGTSKSTVSRALNDSPLVNLETKSRILAIAREHDFHPSTAARALSLRASRTIAYVIDAYDEDCSLDSPFSLEIMGAASMGLTDLGYDMLVVQVDKRKGDWVSDYFGSGRVDGFILMTYEDKRAQVGRLEELEAPFVVWGCCESSACCSVSGDNYRGGLLAGRHLAALDRKKPAFIGGYESDGEVAERRRGYAAGLAEGGLELLGREVYGDFTAESGYASMNALLAGRDGLDAVFASGDLMALGAMRALVEAGLRVPDDVAVIGYDDIFVSAFAVPSLTTVSQHIKEAGRLLAENLVARVERGVVSSSTVPVELIKRESA